MSDPVTRLARAEIDAAMAHERLNFSLAVLQQRLEPKRLARETARDLTDAGSAAAARAVDTAKRNPGAVAGVVAAAGLFLGRHRIATLLSRKATRNRDAS